MLLGLLLQSFSAFAKTQTPVSFSSSVKRELNKYVRVRLYTDGEGEPYEGFQKFQPDRFETVALPLYAVLDKDGNSQATFPGLMRSQDEFAGFLQKKSSATLAQK